MMSLWCLVSWQLWKLWLRFSSHKALNGFGGNFVYVEFYFCHGRNDNGPLNKSARIYPITWMFIKISLYKLIQGLINLPNLSNYLLASLDLILIILLLFGVIFAKAEILVSLPQIFKIPSWKTTTWAAKVDIFNFRRGFTLVLFTMPFVAS